MPTEKSEIERILIVQSGFDGLLGPVATACRSRYGTDDISVCRTSSTRRYGSLEGHGLAAVHDLFDLSWPQRLKLAAAFRRRRIDLALITEPDWVSNLLFTLLFAAVCRPRRIEMISSATGRTDPPRFFTALAASLNPAYLRQYANKILVKVSRRLKTSRCLGMPVKLLLETCAYCNIRCPGCPAGQKKMERPQGQMTFTAYRRIIDKCGRNVQSLRLHLFGEPLLNDDIVQMIAYAKRKGIAYVELSTNANVEMDDSACRELVLSGLDCLIVSLDGLTDATYHVYRKGGDIGKVLAFTAGMSQAKKQLGRLSPIIDLQFIVMKHNEHELDRAGELADRLGADNIVPRFFNLGLCEEGTDPADWLPAADAHNQYRMEDGALKLKPGRAMTCQTLWDSLYVTWDGRVIPCCYDGQARHALGDIGEQDLRDIWNGEKFRAFRRQLVKDPGRIALCRTCFEKPDA